VSTPVFHQVAHVYVRELEHIIRSEFVVRAVFAKVVRVSALDLLLERRDPEFKQKMAEVLCVYREVKLIKETAEAAKQEPSDAVATISHEKPGIQAIANTAPDLPPKPGVHATFARDHD
jgi:hypothetical protein